MNSFLIRIENFFRKRSKKPWACIETDGFGPNGVGVSFQCNDAFIEHLHENGIMGLTDDETIATFFIYLFGLMSNRLTEDGTTAITEATPNIEQDVKDGILYSRG